MRLYLLYKFNDHDEPEIIFASSIQWWHVNEDLCIQWIISENIIGGMICICCLYIDKNCLYDKCFVYRMIKVILKRIKVALAVTYSVKN